MRSLAEAFASRLARLLPFGKQDDDPLSSLNAATRWLEDLPVGDAYPCQQAIFDALKRLNENATRYTKDRLAIFMLLDEKSRDLQDTLVSQYLHNPRMSRTAEGRLWHAVYGLQWEIAYGYHALVLNLAATAGKNPRDSQVPLIALRAIRALGQLLKWHAVRYLPAGEKLWLRLHQLYRIAEKGGFHRQPQRAYPKDAAVCCCETAYVHALMLGLANSGTLYPRQLDLIDHWLDNWDGMFQLDAAFAPNAHDFCVDLSADRGPRRVRKLDPDKPLRFWGTAILQQKLHKIQAALREGSTPAQLGLTESARTAESLELLEYLQQQWSALAAREQRRAPRVPAKQRVDVTHGIDAIANQIRAADSPAPFSANGPGLSSREVDDILLYGFVTERTRGQAPHGDASASQKSPDVECWVMQNESKFGYGATVGPRDSDWLRIGALIGLKPHDANQWKIGIVRRLSRLNDDTIAVGIETLVEPPMFATLHGTAGPNPIVNGSDGASQPHNSLWLAGDAGAESLIVDPIHYMPGRVFQVLGVPGRTLIALGSPLERGEGWVRVTAEPAES